MTGQLRLLNIACAAKAKPRVITINRPAREMPLPFTLIGGAERGTRLFISSVEVGSKAEEAGLKRGDQVTPFKLVYKTVLRHIHTFFFSFFV